MKTLSLHLIEGIVDQVDGNIKVNGYRSVMKISACAMIAPLALPLSMHAYAPWVTALQKLSCAYMMTACWTQGPGLHTGILGAATGTYKPSDFCLERSLRWLDQQGQHCISCIGGGQC